MPEKIRIILKSEAIQKTRDAIRKPSDVLLKGSRTPLIQQI